MTLEARPLLAPVPPLAADRPKMQAALRASGALLAASMVIGCAQPGPAGSPGMAQGSAAAPVPSQITRFAPERSAQLRNQLEGRGWALLSSSVRRTDPPGSGVEMLSFVDPASVARTGNLVRVRTLNVNAAPIGAMISGIAFQQVDCQARTLQTMAQDHFSDDVATMRIASTNRANPPAPVQAQSLGETLLNSVCAGRFAGGAVRPGAPPAGAPRAGTGSGVVIGAQRVLTNAHVVANCKTIEVSAAGQRHAASIRKRDASTDLALLEVAALPPTTAPRLRRQAQVGEAVMAAGYPLSGLLGGADLVVTDGIVNALSGLGNSTTHLQMSTAIQPGNSGGPLLDRAGNLVGVVVSKLNALATMVLTGDIPQNVNFAIKPEIVGLFLQSENLPMGAVELGSTLDTQQLASRARTFTVKVDCKP